MKHTSLHTYIHKLTIPFLFLLSLFVFMGVLDHAIAAPTVPGHTVTPFASISRPRGVSFDSAGNLYTMSRDTGTVFKITPTGAVSIVADLPNLVSGYVGPHFDPISGNLFVSRFANFSGNEVLKVTGAGVVSVFASGIPAPVGLTTDTTGNLFVSSYHCPGSIFRVTPGGVVSLFASGLCLPDGLAFGPGGDLFVGNRGTNQIMHVPPTGGTATPFASGFGTPVAVTFDSLGNLFVANANTGTISKVSPTSIVSSFGSGFNSPVGLAFDANGNLFIADYVANLIYKVEMEDCNNGIDDDGDGLVDCDDPDCATISADLNNGLVAYYPFSGNANDESGNGNHGTVFGATLTTDRFGNANSAYSFDGVDDYINVPHSPSLDIAPYSSVTITAWVFRTSPASLMHVVGKRGGCGGGDGFYQLPIGGGAIPSEDVPLNTWTHLTFTQDYDSDTIDLFVDGAIVLTATGYRSWNVSSTAPLKIGTSGTCVGFGGAIDEVKVYYRALSASEIQAIFNADGAVNCQVKGLQMLGNYEFSIEQGYQQAFSTQVTNQDSISHAATVEIFNPSSELAVALGSEGAVSLAPGETKVMPINVDASFASAGSYDLMVKVTSDTGDIIYSNVRIYVTAPGAGNLPDLAITSQDISFSNLNPNPGDTVTLEARVHNKGNTSASNVSVQAFDFDTFLGEVTIDSIAPNSFGTASIPVSFPSSGEHLIRVAVDPIDAILELDENNNEAHQILQVGAPPETIGNILVTGGLPTTVTTDSLFTVSGHAVYEIFVNGVRNTDYVVKGGSVQITIKGEGGGEWVYPGIYTDVNGNFSKLLQAPSEPGTYHIIMTVTDETFTGKRELQFSVVLPLPPSTPPPPPPTSSGGGSWSVSGGTWSWTWTEPPVHEPLLVHDLYVHSEDIYFSNNNPELGEEVTISANIHYWASSTELSAQNVPINFYVTYPGFPKMKIGQTVIDSISVGAPDYGSRYVFASWKNQAVGIYIVEVEIDPSYVEENQLNNAATRAIIVGQLQELYGAISGHVTDPWGGVGGVTINLFDTGGALLTSTVTDDTGGYLFPDVPVGEKQVRIVTPTGHLVDAETKTAIVSTGDISVVDFELSVQNPPVADAGENITLFSESQISTILQGTATDLDNDPLTYRWLEGVTVLQGWTSVGSNGEAWLDLSTVPPFAVGVHTLTLEVDDGISITTDEMLLTIDNSPPHAAPSGGGTYQLWDDITLGGEVSDFDGDSLNYGWHEGLSELYSSSISTIAGGTPVNLPDYVIVGGLPLGVHTITLEADDGINVPVSADITVNVIDTEAPTLQPTVSPGILWPPNHKMVDVEIVANAADNSGGTVTLSAVVASSEPPDADGDGNTIPDYTTPEIDQDTGTISLQLRAERSGKGTGRTYTITITATDESLNSSTADVNILAPHDRGKTK
jgi:hypothetical protein